MILQKQNTNCIMTSIRQLFKLVSAHLALALFYFSPHQVLEMHQAHIFAATAPKSICQCAFFHTTLLRVAVTRLYGFFHLTATAGMFRTSKIYLSVLRPFTTLEPVRSIVKMRWGRCWRRRTLTRRPRSTYGTCREQFFECLIQLGFRGGIDGNLGYGDGGGLGFFAFFAFLAFALGGGFFTFLSGFFRRFFSFLRLLTFLDRNRSHLHRYCIAPGSSVRLKRSITYWVVRKQFFLWKLKRWYCILILAFSFEAHHSVQPDIVIQGA